MTRCSMTPQLARVPVKAVTRTLVRNHFGSPDTITAGGAQRTQLGDPAAALFFYQKAIDTLHSIYVANSGPSPAGWSRPPSSRDLGVVDAYLPALGQVRTIRPGAPVKDSVVGVTHRLRTISSFFRRFTLGATTYRYTDYSRTTHARLRPQWRLWELASDPRARGDIRGTCSIETSRSRRQSAAPSAPTAPAVDWSSIENIRNEWPRAGLDPAADLQRYQQALSLYERDDYASMMQCATLFGTALAHSLYGPGILKGDELPETVHKTLYTSLCAPPDGRTFADSAQKAARLAMTIMRENGWQPPSFGGTITHFEGMMMDRGNNMLLGTAIAPPGQPWAGDLKAFFAMPPQPAISAMPDAEADRGREMVDRLYHAVQEAEAGDTASSLYVDGMALTGRGDYEGALAKYSEAARLGSVDSMASAGDLSRDLGRQADANFWYEVLPMAVTPWACSTRLSPRFRRATVPLPGNGSSVLPRPGTPKGTLR